MSQPLHILSFQKKLSTARNFLQSLLCRQLHKRKLLLEKASGKELRVLQYLLSCYVRGELPISSQVYGRIKRTKKLGLLESHFQKIKFNPQLKKHLLSLASVLPNLIKPPLKKRLSRPVKVWNPMSSCPIQSTKR